MIWATRTSDSTVSARHSGGARNSVGSSPGVKRTLNVHSASAGIAS